jgi:hypothetical protein
MFGRKQKQNNLAFSPEVEKNLNLFQNFSSLCVNKCITDEIEVDISHDEKKCIAKCLDRGYEYLRILENQRK